MKYYNLLKIILLLIFPLNGITAQQLTIDETLNYIENIENKYTGNTLSGFRVTETYEINDEGLLINKTIHSKDGNKKVVKKVSVHVNDILKEFIYNGYSFIYIKCKNNNCFYIEEDGTKYIDRKPRTSYSNDGIRIFVKQEYQAKKVVSALKYLFSLIDQKNYIRDANDPFSNHTVVAKNSNSTNKINLTESNGTFKIQVRFGNLTKYFVLDSGASETTISSILEKELIENGTILSNNYLPDGLYKIADGSIIKQRRVLLKQLSVGDFTIKNISVSIGNKNSPLLLGKNFLDYFKSWSINNHQKTLELTN